MTRKALGRGLGALIPGADPSADPAERSTNPSPDAAAVGVSSSPAETATPESDGVRVVSLESIRPNPYQPRSVFDEGALAELTRSIRENGLIQPLVVRRAGDGRYELIAGERRFMACKSADLLEVPVVIRDATRRQMLEMAVVENLQREDLNPMEEAAAFQRLATEFGLTQEEIAERVGKSRVTVTNSLRLLSLEEELRDLVSQGTLTAGHGRALLSVRDPGERMKLAREITGKGLSVREAESLARGKRKRAKAGTRRHSDPALEAWEERLRVRFGTQVRIAGGTGRGRIEIHYFNEDDLERILELSGVPTQL